MGVESGRGGGVMAQILLDEAQVHTRIEQMSRPGVSQGVDRTPAWGCRSSAGQLGRRLAHSIGAWAWSLWPYPFPHVPELGRSRADGDG